MGQGDKLPKSIRKHNRLGKAGLVFKSGKLMPAEIAFKTAFLANQESQRRADEKARNKIDPKEKLEKIRNEKLTARIGALCSSPKSYSKVRSFVKDNMETLCVILKDMALLPITDDPQVLSRKTAENLISILNSYSLVFNGKEIVKFNGEKL